jgi:hypothetical protein
VPDSPDSTVGRVKLRRIAVSRSWPAGQVREAILADATWPCAELPWSRGLWGAFIPERRTTTATPPGGRDRRR